MGTVSLKLYSWRLENIRWSVESGFLQGLQMEGSEFGMNSMDPWAQPALFQQSRLLLVVLLCANDVVLSGNT